eukprot:1372238-Rhodomonas_salina.4
MSCMLLPGGSGNRGRRIDMRDCDAVHAPPTPRKPRMICRCAVWYLLRASYAISHTKLAKRRTDLAHGATRSKRVWTSTVPSTPRSVPYFPTRVPCHILY